jgi:prepilin-type N-terminal cleavage/methylation domain-containing protein
MPATAAPGRFADKGFTLIELLIYMSLFTIILAIAGGLMIDSLKVERDVRNAAEATSTAQLLSTSVQAAVRNGSGIKLASAGSDGSQILIARTATRENSSGWVCQAWYYSASKKAVYTKTSPTPAEPIAVPTSAPVGAWTLLGSGIGPTASGAGVFKVIGESKSVGLAFEVVAGDRDPVRVETEAYLRLPGTSAPCY